MFIRTKNGVYEVTKDTKGTKFIVVGKNKTLLDYGTFVSSEADIINQSENLTELCDEFVMTHYFKETDYTYREVLKAGKDSMIEAVRLKKINNKSKAIKNEFNIYGCIWIEIKLPKNKSVFRLEPVVIMNDKGDFELI